MMKQPDETKKTGALPDEALEAVSGGRDEPFDDLEAAGLAKSSILSYKGM